MSDIKIALSKKKHVSKSLEKPIKTGHSEYKKFRLMMRKFSEDGKENCHAKPRETSPAKPLVHEEMFPTGSEYKGAWNSLGMNGFGVYKFPNKEVVYEGSFKDGQFHGEGHLKYSNGAILGGIWEHGLIKSKRLVFPDGLEYCENNWGYCKMPDRRFTVEFANGMNPGGKTYMTAHQPTLAVPEGYHDVGFGFYNSKMEAVFKHEDLTSIKRCPGEREIKWILENCRKSPDVPVGSCPTLYEEWQDPLSELESPRMDDVIFDDKSAVDLGDYKQAPRLKLTGSCVWSKKSFNQFNN